MATNSLNNTYQSLLESIREYKPPAQTQRRVGGLAQVVQASGAYYGYSTNSYPAPIAAQAVDWSSSGATATMSPPMVLQGRGFPSEHDYVETPEPFADPEPEFFTPSKRQINVPW